jgi:hypothetical protein
VKKYFGEKMNAGDLYKIVENKSGTITLKKVSN